MFTNPAMIRPISAIKSIPPILVKSFLVVEPIKAIAPKVPAVIKKVLAMAAEEKAAKIQPNVSPLRAAKAMNHIVAAQVTVYRCVKKGTIQYLLQPNLPQVMDRVPYRGVG